MTIYIKNTSGSTGTWCGQEITNTSYYQIQPAELINWQNNSTVLTDIGSGDLTVAEDNSGSTDITDVATGINYLKGVDTSPKDADGSKIYRPKAAKAGWTYHLTAPEFETSVLNSLYHKDADGNNLGQATVKYYNSSDVELTTQGDCDTSCVKTVLDFEPSFDYEIIGGTIKSLNAITNDYRIWVVAVPDLTAAQGGSKVMVENVNLKFVDPNNGVEADGRASKYMTYDATYHTNKLRLTVKHPAGGKEKLMIAFELYKA